MAWSWRRNIQRFLKITCTYVYESCTVLDEFVKYRATGTIASRSGSKGTPCWTTPPSAIAARLSCYKTCGPSCLTRRWKGVIFQCLFLKRLLTTMSDAVMAAGLENIEDMAAMADRLHNKPAAACVAAIAAQPPCCSHVSAIYSKQKKFNRSGRSPNRSGRSPDRRAATPLAPGGIS